MTASLKRRSRSIARWAPLAVLAVAMVLVLPAVASHPEASLSGSNFEIDTDANLKVDDPAPSIDWASVNEDRKADLASGSGDDSFGQGAKEDTAVPTVVSGSIPPQKSDLLTFGVYLETNANSRFLNLFWHRVQEPHGTTNMDFEFNQSDVLSGNGVTPVRTSGDLLIQYDLSRSGASPILFLSRWVDGSEGATAADCEAANSLPCWSEKVNLTASADATGSINTSAIPAAESDGLGNISPRTFGEAQLDFDALTGGAAKCVSFGSAYLKSRSSDSFTSELKDFIAPLSVSLDQCANVIIRKQTDPEEDPNTTSFGFAKSFPTDPSSADTFTLLDDGVKNYNQTVLPGTGYTVDEDVIPAGWNLMSIDCNVAAHPSVGVAPTVDLVNGTVTFDIDASSDVLDCTYTNREQKGAILITKTRKHAASGSGDHPHAGVVFTITGGKLPAGGSTTTTDVNGKACVDGLVLSSLAGDYEVTETVPAGYSGSPISDTVSVSTESACGDGNEAVAGPFDNTPLTDITVSVNSQVEGGTASTFDCGAGVDSTGPNGDGSTTRVDLAPGTYTCTIFIDP